MRRIPALLCALSLLLLSACASPGPREEGLHILATTYPIYLLACSVTQGVEGVTVERLNTGSVSCLHDYTLTVNDMKKIDGADVIVLNGAGLEEFLEDALAASDAAVIDCSQNVELLESFEHEHDEDDHDGHDHGHWDPHYWMDPANARIMAVSLLGGLAELDPDHEEEYAANFRHTDAILLSCQTGMEDLLMEYGPQLEGAGLITFHDGFQYFARACGLPLLRAIEEESGSEASAKEIVEITGLVKEHGIPVIFTEVNGSDATANAIARETGCRVAQLTMLMDGPEESDDPDFGLLGEYFALYRNLMTIIDGFAGEGTVPKG